MILGRFDSFSRRPMLDCYIFIPILNVEGFVRFVMDTGADRTVLMPGDAERLGIDYRDLPVKRTSTGVGGLCRERLANTSLLVSSDTTVYAYRFAMGIAETHPDMDEVPSLLGMDVMRYWQLYLDWPNKRIEVTVQMCDEERPV